MISAPQRYDVLNMLTNLYSRNRMPGAPPPAPPYGGNPEMLGDIPGGLQQTNQPPDAALQAYLEKFGALPGRTPPMPPGLPDAVQRSLRDEPIYRETDVIPSPNSYAYSDPMRYQNFKPELQQDQLERERLPRELGWMRNFNQQSIPMAEGTWARPAPFEDPYSRPPNLGLGRPWALY